MLSSFAFFGNSLGTDSRLPSSLTATDTAGRTVVLQPKQIPQEPGDYVINGHVCAMPAGYEQVYDICENRMVLAKKLEQPRRVAFEFEFTNEHDVRMLETLSHGFPSLKSIREIPPTGSDLPEILTTLQAKSE